MLEALLEYRTDGLILVSPRLHGPQIAAAVGALPCVVIGRRVRSAAIDCVMTDEALGAHLAVEHLVGLGHERIVHVDGGDGRGRRAAPRRLPEGDGRGRPRRVATVVAGRLHRGRGRGARRSGCCAATTLPTAVFAANDLVALGLIDRLEQDGVRIPEDVSVVGYDNTFVAGAQPHPADDDQPAAPRDGPARRSRCCSSASSGRTKRSVRACTSRRSSCARRPRRRDERARRSRAPLRRRRGARPRRLRRRRSSVPRAGCRSDGRRSRRHGVPRRRRAARSPSRTSCAPAAPVFVGGRRARVLRVDRRLDLALLAVAGLRAPAAARGAARAGEPATVSRRAPRRRRARNGAAEDHRAHRRAGAAGAWSSRPP